MTLALDPASFWKQMAVSFCVGTGSFCGAELLDQHSKRSQETSSFTTQYENTASYDELLPQNT